MRTLLVDGNSLLKNSFEGSKNGVLYPNVNGIYIFLRRLRKYLDDKKYTCLKVVFDGKNSGQLRSQIYKDYKISRKKRREQRTKDEQIKDKHYRKQLTNLLNLLSLFCYTYQDPIVEADDVISYYVRNKHDGEKITIVTGDMDILWLLREDVDAIYINKKFKSNTPLAKKTQKYGTDKGILRLNQAKFKKLFGFPSENILIQKTLCGDDSDDIKNICGVREKTFYSLFPKATKEVYDLQRVLTESKEMLNTEGIPQGNKNKLQRILKGENNSDIDPQEFLTTNERLVNLGSDEFITQECKDSLKKSGFLEDKPFGGADSNKIKREIILLGLYKSIKYDYNSLKKFFKPFLKTIQR